MNKMERALIFRTWIKNLNGKAVGCQSLILRQVLETAAHRVHETYLRASRLSSYSLSSSTRRPSVPLLSPAEFFMPDLSAPVFWHLELYTVHKSSRKYRVIEKVGRDLKPL